MGLFSWLFGRKDPAPPVAVENPVQDVQPVALAAPAVIAPFSEPDSPAPVIERPKRKAYVPPPDTPENRRMAAFYDAQRARAKAEGKTVRQLRAGFLGNEETREALQGLLKTGDGDGLRLAYGAKGMSLALPDGRLIDCKNLILRKFGIHCGRIAGTGYHEAGELPRRDGMKLGMLRDPENEYDANAVALMRGKPSVQLGWVAKGTAKFVARELDAGNKLVAHAVLGGRYVLITTPEKWAQLKS